MGQPRSALLVVIVCWAGATTSIACDPAAPEGATPSTSTTRPAHASPTVASLVPAATDIILSMGAGNHLVAVSNYDTDRPSISGLPRVGDYQGTDWEKLASLKPQLMVRQFAAGRAPAGMRERADALGIRIINLEIDPLDSIFAAHDVLGDALNERAKSDAAKQSLRTRLDVVASRTKNLPRVSALIVTDDSGRGVVGPGAFLHELLEIAGGTNAAAALGAKYAQVDDEKLRALDPQVIFHLMPGSTPQVVDASRRRWEQMSELRAVRDKRVYVLTDWYLLLPGAHVADVAETFAGVLHVRGAAVAATRPDGATTSPARSLPVAESPPGSAGGARLWDSTSQPVP